MGSLLGGRMRTWSPSCSICKLNCRVLWLCVRLCAQNWVWLMNICRSICALRLYLKCCMSLMCTYVYESKIWRMSTFKHTLWGSKLSLCSFDHDWMVRWQVYIASYFCAKCQILPGMFKCQILAGMFKCQILAGMFTSPYLRLLLTNICGNYAYLRQVRTVLARNVDITAKCGQIWREISRDVILSRHMLALYENACTCKKAFFTCTHVYS